MSLEFALANESPYLYHKHKRCSSFVVHQLYLLDLIYCRKPLTTFMSFCAVLLCLYTQEAMKRATHCSHIVTQSQSMRPHSVMLIEIP